MTKTERMMKLEIRTRQWQAFRHSEFGIPSDFVIRHSSFCHLARSQGVISSARRSAKAEVRGAIPRESASFKSEILMPKSERMKKFEIRSARPFSSFGIRPSFGFRPSDFGCSRAPVPQQQQGEFRKLVFVGASPTRGSISW